MSHSAEYNDGLFVQMLKGDYGSYTEDRLTQITAACFNRSAAFRRCFLVFLGVSRKIHPSKCTAKTQVSTVGRLDLAIYRSGRIVAIVENKVDAPLHPNQLKNYSSDNDLKSAKKFALVKNYFATSKAYDGWKILHWRDFYLVLFELLQSQKHLTDIDRFIIQNFIEYLEDANMHVPTRITKSAMSSLAKTLHGLRYVEKTKYAWLGLKPDVFQTAADWIRMMEAVFEESRANKKIAKAAKKNYRFSPQLRHWWEAKNKNDKLRAYRWISIQGQVSFPKPRGKTKTVGIGLFVDEEKVWSICAFRDWVVSDTIDEFKVADSHSDIVLADLTKKVLKKWNSWIS